MKLAASLRLRFAALGAAAVFSACGGGSSAPEDDTTTMPTTQGVIQSTGRPLDLAIAGAGLFALRDRDGSPVYSRVGRFDLDRNGRLVHAEGWQVAGRATDAAPDSDAQPLPPLPYTMAGTATTRVTVVANLDESDVGYPDRPFDALDPRSFQSATAVVVRDRNGAATVMPLFFTHVGPGEWHVHASVGSDGQALPEPIARLHFPFGELSVPVDAAPVNLPASPLGPWGPTEPITGVTIDWTGTTAHRAGFTVTQLTTDGYAPGNLANVLIDDAGRVTAHYDNGQQRSAGQLLLARFALLDRLERVGVSGLRCAALCDAPIVAPPGQWLLGNLVVGALEERP